MRRLPSAITAGLLVGALVLVPACSSGGDDDAKPVTTSTVAANGTTGSADHDHGTDPLSALSSDHSPDTSPGACPMHELTDVLSEDEAVVEFSPERVCPGYVTVVPGTKVSWENQGKAAATVEIFTTTKGKDTVIDSHQVPAGETWQRPFPDSGVFFYRASSIEGFQGTVEALNADGTSTGH